MRTKPGSSASATRWWPASAAWSTSGRAGACWTSGAATGASAPGSSAPPPSSGRYDGFDLLEPHIAWCNAHLGDKRTKFHYLPIYSERYNPGGTLQQTEVRFDVPDGCADLIVLTSVFTHMYPDDVVHYLRECRRLLSSRGRVYATFFMMNERQGGRPNVYPLPHELTPFARFMNPEEPLHVIAYTEDWLREQFAAVGLQVDGAIRQGEWSGEPDPFDFQDTVLLVARRPHGRARSTLVATLSTEREITGSRRPLRREGQAAPRRSWLGAAADVARQPARTVAVARSGGTTGASTHPSWSCRACTPMSTTSGLANVWVMERSTGRQATAGVLKPFARGFAMPEQVCTGTVTVRRTTRSACASRRHRASPASWRGRSPPAARPGRARSTSTSRSPSHRATRA